MIERVRRLIFLSGLLVLGLASLPGYGQVDYSTATLQGVVFDPQGAAIPGASVTVVNRDTGLTKTVKGSAEGRYVIPVLQPGTYRITIEASGFSKEVVETFTLTVGTVSVHDAHLKVGAAGEIVEVVGDSAPIILTTQTQQADSISLMTEQNIPSVGRDYSAAIQQLAGVTNAEAIHSSGAQRNIGAFPVNNFTTGGGNGRGGLVTIDGGENDYGSGASRTAHISPDAIQELQVNRNSFTAEFGFTLAEHVNVVTKSGGNQMHGAAFGLFRDQKTDSKPFFQASSSSFPNTNPMNQDWHVGGSLGGTLVKDKLFFFLNTEAYRTTFEALKTFNTPFVTGPSKAQSDYLNLVASKNPALVPQLNALRGALTPINIPFVQQLIAGQSGFFPGDEKWFDSVARLDWQPNVNNTFTLRFLHEREDAPLALGGGAGGFAAGVQPTTAASFATQNTLRDYEALATWSHIFSPTLLNTLRIQLVPDNVADLSWNNGHGGATTPFSAFTDGFGTFGPLLGAEVFGHQRRYQFEDSVTWTVGKHTLKFGESFRPVKYTYFDNLYAHSQVAYVPGILSIFTPAPGLAQPAIQAAGPPKPETLLTSLQSFAFGLPTQFRTSTGNNALIANWAYYGGVYFQDSWKMTPRLSVDAGIRFDADDESFPNSTTNYYASPRIGLAYDLTGDAKTVIRAGGGIFVAPAQFQNAYYSNLYNPTGALGFAQAVETIGGVDYFKLRAVLQQEGNLPILRPVTAADYAAAGITIAEGQPNGIGIINPANGYKNNYGIQTSLSIQRALSQNMSIEVGYNMQHTMHLQDPLEVGWINNPNVPSNPLFGPTLMENPANNPVKIVNNQPVPTFETLTNYCACGGAIYHAGTVSLIRRFANHLQFQTNYTWSKAIDDTLDFSSFTSSYYPTIHGKDRATSAFNVGQIFTSTAVYTTPFSRGSGSFFTRALADITLAPIVSLRSGTPFEIFFSPPTGFGTTSPGNGLVQEALNQARPFNAPRNSGILPWNYRWDMRFNKDIHLSEAVRLGLSVTAANLLNHTNFTGVNGIFPVGTAIDPNTGLLQAQTTLFPNGGNLLNGPYNLRGVKAFDFNDPNFPIAGTKPLSFNSADTSRQVQFGLRVSF